MKKLIMVVLDGAADVPNKSIGNKTAFEAAYRPNLDNLARKGVNGVVKVLPIPPESDEAVISLLGYDIFKVYTGRGPLEAIGGGIPFKEGDLAVRCNFAIIENGAVKDVRIKDMTTEEAKQLEEAINSFVTLTGATFTFKSTVAYRGILTIQSNNKLSSKITNTHPEYATKYFEPVWDRSQSSFGVPFSEALVGADMTLKESRPTDMTKEAAFSAKLVNEFIEKSRAVLYKNPVNLRRMAEGLQSANIILTRNAGTSPPRLFNMRTVYDMNWLCMADMPVERGIGISAGMQVMPLPEPSGNIQKDMSIRVLALLKNLNLYDAFYVHLKGPDIFAHNEDINGKVRAIEEIDKYFFGPLLANMDLNNTIIAVTCDHTTSSEIGLHTDDPVPLTISGGGIVGDGTSMFSEPTCARGALKQISALQLMPYLMKLIKS